MERKNFTATLVSSFKCQPNKQQSIYWDAKTPGLGLRVTAAGAKAFIFEASLNSKTIRMTIGDPRTWKVGDAQAEATRLKSMTDQSIDPRKVIADARASEAANVAAKTLQEARESVTIKQAWEEYIAARKPYWGQRHYEDHIDMMHLGGETRMRSKKLTEPGVLASLAEVRLVELTPERVTDWARIEGENRPGRARLANRHLKAFLAWCMEHSTYRTFIKDNPAKIKATKELLGKPQFSEERLQREQLPAWFNAVRQIGNPIISVYLQALLLTGARPNELNALRWADVDFQWSSMAIRDKVEGIRVIPLTPFLGQLLNTLPRRSEYVFSSPSAESGHLEDPHDAHYKVRDKAGLNITLYDLRGSFSSLCEWVEMPSGISGQIQGHKPSGVREKHYIRRPLDLLRLWHVKIETWILEQAGIELAPTEVGLHVVKRCN